MILGAGLLDNATLDQAEAQLQMQDFSLQSHRHIYGAMLQMRRAGQRVDPLGLQEQLRQAGHLEYVGGAAYIAALFDGVPRFSNIENYVRAVKQSSWRRNLIHAAMLLQSAAFDETQPIEDLQAMVASKISALGEPQEMRSTVTSLTAAEQTIAELTAGWERTDGLLGLPTGFNELNRWLYGFRPESLYTIAAPSGMGKTTLALNCAGAMAEAGGRGLFVSLEMSVTELGLRFIAGYSGIDSDRIVRNEFYDDAERAAYRRAVERLAGLGIEYVDNTDALTPSYLRNLARRFKREHKRLDFIVVDYLQLLNADAKHENEVQRLTELSRAMKAMAREFNVAVVALSQMNNEFYKRGWQVEPQLGDLRGSGSIAHDSNVVLFLWPVNGADETDNRRHLIIRKNRGGQKDRKVPLIFDGATARFLPADPHSFYTADDVRPANPRKRMSGAMGEF